MHVLKKVMLLLIITVIALVTGCSKKESLTVLSPQEYHSETEYHEALLSQFVTRQLWGEYGIYTNYLDNEQLAEVATGHEVLSESSGLMLRYFVLIEDEKNFKKLLDQTIETFNMKSGFSYRYSPLNEKRYTINAAVDDLRIIRSLYEASETFKDQNYLNQAVKLTERFMTYNVDENKMFDFYDETYELTNQFITLCYIDLKTLALISNHLSSDSLISNLLNIAKEGYISDEFPLYETRYVYETEEYQSENINTVESLITILHLAEVGEQNSKSIAFIKEKVMAEQLFGQYTMDGTALNDVQSTAIYAITAMIGSQIGDEQLYEKSIELMQRYMIADEQHQLFGAFANNKTNQLYSFDNLQALLAYRY